jgi:hypothetical protein
VLAKVHSIRLNRKHSHAAAVRAAFQPLLAPHGTRLRLGQIQVAGLPVFSFLRAPRVEASAPYSQGNCI